MKQRNTLTGHEYISYGKMLFAALIIMLLIMVTESCKRIKIVATNCLLEDISIVDTSRISSAPGDQWTLVSTVTILCKGQPVPDAEIIVEYWWEDRREKMVCDQNGQVTVRKRGHGGIPSNRTFEVTVKGTDGSRTETHTVP